MSATYFKRYRMEIDLRRRMDVSDDLPDGYRFVPWSADLIQLHAEAKHRSFQWEVDAGVFRCLGEYDGCYQLMREISARGGFSAPATWLIVHESPGSELDACGTIQGIVTQQQVGSIQNVGVVPGHRGQGLGAALVNRSLAGFRTHGLRKATLEVTARNTGAVRLYRRLGFRHVRTVYKSVEVAFT